MEQTKHFQKKINSHNQDKNNIRWNDTQKEYLCIFQDLMFSTNVLTSYADL